MSLWLNGCTESEKAEEKDASSIQEESARETDSTDRLTKGIPQEVRRQIERLGSLDPKERLAAVKELSKSNDPDIIKHLFEALKDSDFYVSKAAAGRLRLKDDPRVVDLLISALDDNSINARRNAAWSLGLMKERRAVEPLIECLQDDEGSVRMNAATALGKIRDSRATKHLISTLRKDDASVVCKAARALGEIGSGEMDDDITLDALIETLDHRNPNVRHASAIALGDTEDPRAIEPLITYLKNARSKKSRVTAGIALKMITGQKFGTDISKWEQWWIENKGRL
jgi:HEAT repeat protein